MGRMPNNHQNLPGYPDLDISRLHRIASTLVGGGTVVEEDKLYMEEQFTKFPINARGCPVRTVSDRTVTRNVMDAMQRYGSDWESNL